ncbi:hypothetical protein EON65_22345 [archaeon]|nr:MAG: hypothetical protein EON65_22345 [archaeon]
MYGVNFPGRHLPDECGGWPPAETFLDCQYCTNIKRKALLTMTSTSEEDTKLLLLLDELIGRLSQSYVKMSSRSQLKRLLQSFAEHEDSSSKPFITEYVKATSTELLGDLEHFLISSRVGILKRHRVKAQKLLMTLECALRGTTETDQFPKDPFEAVQLAAQRVLPANMKHSVATLGRRPVTVYVDPKHESYSSTPEIASAIESILREHNQLVTFLVEEAENGTIFTVRDKSN